MTAKERIRAVLDGTKGPICDDCLPALAGLSWRQHANAQCRRLHEEGKIGRGPGECARCGGEKLVNRRLPSEARYGLDAMVAAPGFVAGIPQRCPTEQRLPSGRKSPRITVWPPAESANHYFGHYPFARVCEIHPDRDPAGDVRAFIPSKQSLDPRALPLHTYGSGPFCRFRIPSTLPLAGVYLLVVCGRVRYVGECENLSRRFNAGYGQISSRSCCVRGQSTNCKVNYLLAEAAARNERIELWFYQTENRWQVEQELITHLQPDWNSRGRASPARKRAPMESQTAPSGPIPLFNPHPPLTH